jgi:hypothetical protein
VNSEIKKTRLGFDFHTEIKYIMNNKKRVNTVRKICIIKLLDYAIYVVHTSLYLVLLQIARVWKLTDLLLQCCIN